MTQIVNCNNKECGHNEGFASCLCPNIALEKTWNGMERDWKLKCLSFVQKEKKVEEPKYVQQVS